jgi:hypothetical protein
MEKIQKVALLLRQFVAVRAARLAGGAGTPNNNNNNNNNNNV